MKIKKIILKVDKTLLLLGLLLVLALGAALSKGGWELAYDGFSQAGRLFSSVWLRLLLGFILGGLIKVLIPNALVAKWLGHSSGIKGILIGSYLGILIPGGPFVFLPIIASIYSAGAGAGPVIALLTGQAMLGLNMMVVWQMPILGLEIPIARFVASLIIPPLVGLAGAAVFKVIGKNQKVSKISMNLTHQENNNEVPTDGMEEK